MRLVAHIADDRFILWTTHSQWNNWLADDPLQLISDGRVTAKTILTGSNFIWQVQGSHPRTSEKI
jgi:hypothetical protein